MKTQREVDQIVSDVLLDMFPQSSQKDARYYLDAERRMSQAKPYCRKFTAQMQFGVPYQTEAEAINALAPVAFWFFGWAARQFAIYVIKLLWARWHSSAA